jgi:DNA-3-methyladenine glycosylase II
VIETLAQVKGIGDWTAHMFLMVALRRPDALPVVEYGSIVRHPLARKSQSC